MSLFATLALVALQDAGPRSFERLQLAGEYYSEGINFGDVDHDGKPDIVHGPFWFKGPEFKVRGEIRPPKPQNRKGYADSFFSWVADFNGDGWNDVFAVGFPGTPAHVYENPGTGDPKTHWKRHQVFDWVSNESPHFTNLVGDARPELVCTRDGRFGYAVPAWDKPFAPWTFHAVSDDVATKKFGHGLGVGDVDGDGKADILMKNGWYRQPPSRPEAGNWDFHRFPFTRAGGAEMYATDVDGDGDNDVITSLEAHAYGLAWFEHVGTGDEITFKRHLIMGRTAAESSHGVLFTELHTVALADIDGDGLKDIVTGKTYWSHHEKSPMWDAGAVVYWYGLKRTSDGVDWVPHLADGEVGVGRQAIVGDLNGDGLPDIAVGGMKGAHVLLHRKR